MTSRVARWIATCTAVAAALLCGVVGCAAPPSVGGVPREVAALQQQQPRGAYYLDGQLVLHYELGKEPAYLAASWPVDDLDPETHNLKMAVLDLVAEPPAAAEALRQDWQPVTLFDYARWQALVAELLERFAPDEAGTGTLVTVQHTDFVLHRGPGGSLRIDRLTDKPDELAIALRISEEAFSAEANERVRAELSREPRIMGPALFAVGEDEFGTDFVLFDFEHRQSVFIAHSPSDMPPAVHVDFSLRLIDAVTLRSHVFSALRQPVTMTHRLFWLAAHSGAAALPRGVPPAGKAPDPAAAAPMDPAKWDATLDGIVGPDRYRGSMKLLIDGEAFFESLIESILGAQSSVDVRLYIFDRDDYALRIGDLLKQRSREIKVRVLIDRLGSLVAGHAPQDSPYYTRVEQETSIVDYLRRDSEVKVRVVDNPWFTSDHTKAIIVDRNRAYVGGMNVGYEYRYEWHDLMVEVEGPIVGRLRKDFDKRWAHTGLGGDLGFAFASLRRERHAGPSERQDYIDIRPLYTRTGDAQILRAQLAAMREARSRIWIQQPYVSDDQVIAELIRARRRGVDVRFIMPLRSDSGFMNSANLVMAKALINNGVRVYIYPGMTHVKAALYDDWAIVGSANFDKLSLRINQETNLATSDPGFVAQLERELFEADFARATEWTEPAPVGWRDYIAKIVAGQL
jgi:cardiolipin synthase A/B